MAYRRLFDSETMRFTEEGLRLSHRIGQLLEPIAKEALENNICLRDLEYVVNSEISMVVGEQILGLGVKRCREARKGGVEGGQERNSENSRIWTLDEMVRAKNHKSNILKVFSTLLKEKPEDHDDGWTNTELARKVGIFPSAVHKFKTRLLGNGILEPSPKARTRFRLSTKGKEEIEAKLNELK